MLLQIQKGVAIIDTLTCRQDIVDTLTDLKVR